MAAVGLIEKKAAHRYMLLILVLAALMEVYLQLPGTVALVAVAHKVKSLQHGLILTAQVLPAPSQLAGAKI
jgi:nucleoside recognition membrane protein YjiH